MLLKIKSGQTSLFEQDLLNRYSNQNTERSNDPMLNYAAKGVENVDFLNSGTMRTESNDERTMSNLTRKEYLNGRYQQTRNS